MGNATTQKIKQVKGGGAIESIVTAAESETAGGIRYRISATQGMQPIGPLISLEHAFPAPAAKPLGVMWAVNATAEAAVVSYTFSVSDNETPGEAERHCIHTWTAAPVEIIEQWQPSGVLAVESLPRIEIASTRMCVVIGEVLGLSSQALPGGTASMAECLIPSGETFMAPGNSPYSAVYVANGMVSIEGRDYRPGMMAVIASGWSARMVGKLTSVVIVIGGVPPRLSRQSLKWSW